MITLFTEPLYVTYIAALAVSICISFALLGYLWQRRHKAVIPVIGLLTAIIFWSAGYMLEQLSPDVNSKLFMYNIEYLGIATIPIFFFLFALLYGKMEHMITPRRIVLLSVIPAITIVLVWTKDFHSLMYQNMTPVTDGAFFYIETQYGAWFWLFLAYSYLLNTASMVILILSLMKNPRLNFNQTLVIAFIVIPPIIANILYVFRLMPELAYIDWTGPAFAISAICMTVATTRQRLLDYLPVARDRAIEMMNDGYVVLDGDMRIIDLNEAMQKILDLPAGKAIGNTFPEIISEQMNLQADEAATMEIVLGKQRKKRYYRVHCSPLKEDARSDEGRILLFYDITASKQIERKLAFMATHDYLTGLPNRLLLEDRFRLSLARAKRSNNKFAIMVCDIDNFKMINDTCGHLTADKVLQTTAKRIRGILRAEDTLARIGGDEFVILAAGITNEKEADIVAQRVMMAFRDAFSVDTYEIPVSLSIGISLYPDDGTEIGTLLKKADDAMYFVKGQAKINHHIFKSDTD